MFTLPSYLSYFQAPSCRGPFPLPSLHLSSSPGFQSNHSSIHQLEHTLSLKLYKTGVETIFRFLSEMVSIIFINNSFLSIYPLRKKLCKENNAKMPFTNFNTYCNYFHFLIDLIYSYSILSNCISFKYKSMT